MELSAGNCRKNTRTINWSRGSQALAGIRVPWRTNWNQISCPHVPGFWLTRSRVESENLYSKQVPPRSLTLIQEAHTETLQACVAKKLFTYRKYTSRCVCPKLFYKKDPPKCKWQQSLQMPFKKRKQKLLSTCKYGTDFRCKAHIVCICFFLFLFPKREPHRLRTMLSSFSVKPIDADLFSKTSTQSVESHLELNSDGSFIRYVFLLTCFFYFLILKSNKP